MSTQRFFVGAAAAAATLAGGASAATVTVELQGSSAGSQITGMTIGGQTYNATGGAFTFNVSAQAGADNALAGISQVTTFCIELNEQVGGQAYTDVNVYAGSDMRDVVQQNDGSTPSPDKITTEELRQLSWLFDNHFADVTSGAASQTEINAFQLLVWEIVYEDSEADLSLSSGGFVKSDDDVKSKAVEWLTAEGVDNTVINGWGINEQLVALSRDGNFQDQITMIPLPAAALMGLAGLGGVLVARRRMRQA